MATQSMVMVVHLHVKVNHAKFRASVEDGTCQEWVVHAAVFAVMELRLQVNSAMTAIRRIMMVATPHVRYKRCATKVVHVTVGPDHLSTDHVRLFVEMDYSKERKNVMTATP